MAGYTIVNMMEIENGAVEGGATLDVRFARKHIDSEHLGVSGSVKLDDERVDLRKWDIVRVAPTTFRGFEAGPDGLELLAIGSDRPEGGDGVMADEDWWGD